MNLTDESDQITHWAQSVPLSVSSSAVLWHAFACAPTPPIAQGSLCGASFAALGPLRVRTSIPGEVCHECRVISDWGYLK